MEAAQLKALRFLFHEYTSSYDKLLKHSGEPSISIHLIWALAIEVYKCLHKVVFE